MGDDERPSDDEIADQIRQARQALADARGAREAELSDAVVVTDVTTRVFTLRRQH